MQLERKNNGPKAIKASELKAGECYTHEKNNSYTVYMRTTKVRDSMSGIEKNCVNLETGEMMWTPDNSDCYRVTAKVSVAVG